MYFDFVPRYNPFRLSQLSISAKNGTSLSLIVNEWLAANSIVTDPADGHFDDWFELYNTSADTISLEGYSLTDNLAFPRESVIPAGFDLAPHGFLLVWADQDLKQNSTNGALHVNFKLRQAGDTIALFAPDGRVVDAVQYGTQTNNLSQGRYPDGAEEPFYFLRALTLGSANPRPETFSLPIRMMALRTTPDSIQLQWSTEPGRYYRILTSPTLQTTLWQPLGRDLLATGSVLSFEDPAIQGTHIRFYRIERVP